MTLTSQLLKLCYIFQFLIHQYVSCVPIDECSSNTCLNGGTCEDAADSYFCSCLSGFKGDRCETNIHSCYGQICQNNGTFHIESNSFYCVCTDGFTGQRCEINVNDCNVLNCQNGGSCQIDVMNNYTCRCPDGFTGNNCETEVNNDTILQVKSAYSSNFDTLENLILMEGTEQSNFSAQVPGQINYAVRTNRNQSQWIDLGVHTEACMTLPGTCGRAGGAISLWVKVINCPSNESCGIIITLQGGRFHGFLIRCLEGNIRNRVRLPDERFTVTAPKPSGWFHIVLNYIPGNETTDVEEPGHEIRIYHDGILVGSDFSEGVGFAIGGDGRIVIGQSYLPGTRNTGNSYISVEVDELMFFNKSLTENEITILSQLTS